MADYSRFTVKDLQKELRSRNAKVTGKKEVLIERLLSYDRNDNFRGVEIVLPPRTPVQWPSQGFKQLTPEHRQQVPPVSKAKIEAYFLYRICADHQKTGDIKALLKGQKMVDAKKVEACSMLLQDDEAYFTGITKASMKKKVTYFIKLRLSARGEVVNSACECSAGDGPHGTCKHLAATLLALAKFVDDGTLMINKSCTEILQSFHQPTRQHDGSPLKLVPETNMQNGCQKDDDPRPAAYRMMDSYQDHVANVTINCMSLPGVPKVTLLHAIPAANVPAICLDHTYPKKPIEYLWLENIIKVTESEAKSIERATRGQRLSTEWFEERKWRLTASKFGDICTATEARNMDLLCHSILNPPDAAKIKSLQHGQAYEGVAIEEFAKKRKLTVKACGLFVDVERPHLGATPDGIIGDDALLEVKCAFSGQDDMIAPGKKFPCLTSDKDGKIHLKRRHKYMYQIQGQLHIAKKRKCFFVLHTHNDLHVEEIMYDPDMVAGMLPVLDEFYESHLKRQIVEKYIFKQ